MVREDLDKVVRGISHTEKLFIGGDFNGLAISEQL